METKNISADALLASLDKAAPKTLAASAQLHEHYASVPVPTRKIESYRYSVLAKEFDRSRTLASSTTNIAAAQYLLAGVANFAVVVNGIFRPELSNISEKGISVQSISAVKQDAELVELLAQKHSDKFSALNSAFASDGLFISIKKNTLCENPLQLIFISEATGEAIANVRNAIVAGEGSAVKIVQTQAVISGQLLNNIHTDIVMKDGAQVEINLLADEKDTDIAVNNINVNQGRNTQFTANFLCLNGGAVRNNLIVNQNGEFCTTTVNGIALSSRTQHLDNYVVVNHNMPNGTTNEIFRCIAKDESTCAFAGTIYVARDAQKTLASQSNKNILLSDNATIHSKPQLEIYADDVSCSHGSTTGQLDPQQIFYMQSRGISREKAVHLLLAAFFGDVISKLSVAGLAEKIELLIEQKI